MVLIFIDFNNWFQAAAPLLKNADLAFAHLLNSAPI